MINIYVGNAISFISSVFLLLSSIAKSRRKIYLYQSLECLLLLFSQLCFGQLAAALVMLFGVIRNLLLTVGKYNRIWMIVFFVLTAVIGIKINTGGYIGLIPVFATLAYTISTKYAKSYINVKLSLLANLILWSTYSFLIMDYVSATVNSLAAVLTLLSLLFRRVGT